MICPAHPLRGVDDRGADALHLVRKLAADHMRFWSCRKLQRIECLGFINHY
jgi:hypothetical protein